MSTPAAARFGFVAAAAGAPGATDKETYADLLRDCEHGARLGYTSAWVIEHHFSNYFPTPDPIGLLQHIAARFPRLDLGTCVIVTPWYEPLRLAGSICQLNNLTEGALHIGLGRGTAKYEYDAFGIDMEQARDRFKESLDILRLALGGEHFTYRGELLSVPRRIQIRPHTDASKVHLYGAIGSPSSAQIMGSLGLPAICTAMGDAQAQKDVIALWKASYVPRAPVPAVRLPVMVNCIVEETDEAAIEQAKIYMPRFMQAQVDHYTVDETDWGNTKGYEAWAKIFASMKARCHADNIPPWTTGQFIGSPQTVRRRLASFIECGFDTFLIHTATPGVPPQVRRRWLQRFAEEVIPHQAAGGR